jgi:hypothetical protein
MKRRDDSPQDAALEQAITESLDALARVRVTVSVEDRVMARVRTHAAAFPRRTALSHRQKAALGTAAVTAAAGEIVFWAAVAIVALQLPGLSGLSVAFGWMPDFTGTFVTLVLAWAEVTRAVTSAGFAVLNGVALLLPSPLVLAALFALVVSCMTFIAVRRDLQRSPAARGLR